MASNKTVETQASVDDFLASVENATRREDARVLVELMQRVTGVEPKMWGSAIIGFGKYKYRYESGREGEMLRVGFSPRKANLALYLISKGPDFAAIVGQLGKYNTGASCLYINKLSDVDPNVLESLIAHSWQSSREAQGPSA